MNKILSKPVSFKLAKLAKEKGFDEPTNMYYEHALTSQKDKETNDFTGAFGWKKGETNLSLGFFRNNGGMADCSNNNWYMCSAPTIAEMLDYIFDKYKIWIVCSYEIDIETNKTEWFWAAIKDGEELAWEYNSNPYETAIEYVLLNFEK